VEPLSNVVFIEVDERVAEFISVEWQGHRSGVGEEGGGRVLLHSFLVDGDSSGILRSKQSVEVAAWHVRLSVDVAETQPGVWENL
jgi:hypothetical protein